MRRLRSAFLSLLLVVGIAIGAVTLWLAPGRSAPVVDAPESVPRLVTVSPQTRTLRSVVALPGTVVRGRPLDVVAPIRGVIESKRHTVGDSVAVGEVLGTITDQEGAVEVVAGVPGRVVSWAVADQDQVTGGQILGAIAPDAFEAIATVPPELLYRFYGPPLGVTASIARGPAPFECPVISLASEDPESAASAVLLRCAIPTAIRAFAGSQVTLGAVTGEAANAMTLPVEAVIGQADRGFVTVAQDGGDLERREVILGLTDGVAIQIVEGLASDERVTVPPAE